LSGLIGLRLKSLFPNAPQLINFHTLALMKNLVARRQNEQPLPQRIKAELKLVKQVDKIIIPSLTGKSYLQYLYQTDPQKIIFIPPGIDLNLFKPFSKSKAKKHIKANHDHKIVLFIGRLEPLKGIDALIYAIKILATKHPKNKICLWIVGSDDSQHSVELKKLINLKNILNIPASVKFVSQKPQTDLPFYYNASDVVVMPSHYESFGMVALEALACNTPVVTTDVSGVSNLIIQIANVNITSTNNPLSLADNIEQLLFKNNGSQQKIKNPQQNLKHLTWKNMAKKVYSLYYEL